MKPHRLVSAFVNRTAFSVGAAALFLACKGPVREERASPIDLPEQAPMVVQWADGPRRDNAEREMEKQAQRVAAGLFRAEPMAPSPEGDDGAAPTAAPVAVEESFVAERPSWADGVEKPADAGGDQLPQGWPVEVRRGETPAVLADWAGTEVKALVDANLEGLGGRKWFKVGDRITVTMSADRKVAFDRKREQFQKERVDAFFSNRYFEKVIVYRVKKGEMIASAAKRYGDVPLWLIEEFNQMDFRGLQPGDEILLPVVGQLPQGVRQPPPPVVVDEEGHPLSETRSGALEPRLRSQIFARARMALDDSNVFARARDGEAAEAPAPQIAAPMLAPALGYPRPEQVLPAAMIGSGLLPNYGGGGSAGGGFGGGAAVNPASAGANAAPLSAGVGQGIAPVAPGKLPAQTPRDVVVRRGESLMHYVMWSKTPLDAIKTANQGHLDPERIFIGARIAIPMTDDQYVQFVTARAAWDKEREESAKLTPGGKGGGGGADKPAKAKRHAVKSGETATSIARAHRITVKELKGANPGVDLKRLKIGAKLALPAKAK